MPTPDQPKPPVGFDLTAEAARQTDAGSLLIYTRPMDITVAADHVDGQARLDDDRTIGGDDDIPGDL